MTVTQSKSSNLAGDAVGLWGLAAPVAELAEAGAYVTCDVGPTPVIVIRGSDLVLRAFVNMCRHRGMALLDGCGQIASTISCPYHAWKFDTEGKLKVIAQRASQFEGVDQRALGLLPASVAEWGGYVFASGDVDAVPTPAAFASAMSAAGGRSPFFTGKVANDRANSAGKA